jgi:hypothetical protein
MDLTQIFLDKKSVSIIVICLTISVILYLNILFMYKSGNECYNDDEEVDDEIELLNTHNIHISSNNNNNNNNNNNIHLIRIAIHLTGQVRDTIALETLREHIINRNSITNNFISYQVDVYSYTDKTVTPYIESIIEMTEDNNPLPSNDLETKMNNPTIMFYRMYRLQQAFEEHCITKNIQYDIVIRCRPDIIYHRPLSTKTLIEALRTIVFCPRVCLPLRPYAQKMNDVLFLGPPEKMKIVNNIYLATLNKPVINPEVYLYNYLSELSMDYKYMKYDYTLSMNSIKRFSVTSGLAKGIHTMIVMMHK